MVIPAGSRNTFGSLVMTSKSGMSSSIAALVGREHQGLRRGSRPGLLPAGTVRPDRGLQLHQRLRLHRKVRAQPLSLGGQGAHFRCLHPRGIGPGPRRSARFRGSGHPRPDAALVHRTSQGGRSAKWCMEWYFHPEAVSRVEAIWKAWEHLRFDGATGMSVWWRDHADHHMRVLLDPHGPFYNCDKSGHRDPKRDVPREFDAAVRSVDVLTAWPGRTQEPSAEFRRGNLERGGHLQIHATSAA